MQLTEQRSGKTCSLMSRPSSPSRKTLEQVSMHPARIMLFMFGLDILMYLHVAEMSRFGGQTAAFKRDGVSNAAYYCLACLAYSIDIIAVTWVSCSTPLHSTAAYPAHASTHQIATRCNQHTPNINTIACKTAFIYHSSTLRLYCSGVVFE